LTRAGVEATRVGLSYDLLNKTLDLETGQWLFVSYKATKRKNVPVLIQAPDNGATLAEALLATSVSGKA